jgi:3-phenylpropionate/trans-cinnamate dioxygenase ferredoxin reductase component
MADRDPFVIVGAGLAGAKAAEALREQGYDGPLVLVGAEEHRPYERPLLSKGYLTGSDEREKVFVHDEQWYAEHDVELHLDDEITGLDPAGHRITAGGPGHAYRTLLLATGARPRPLQLPGADAADLYYLRTLGESDRLRELFARSPRLVVIGAGWIGLEVTAAARAAGATVTVVESAQLPLLRVLGPEVAEVFAELHREHEVDLRLGAKLREIRTSGGATPRATGVGLDDGTVIEADAVVVAVGVAPNTELAAAGGLRVDDGIVVDAALRSSNPDIYAAGDVARAFHPFYNKHIRVEHWANALNQPATAAAAMLGKEASYTNLPYFYTDQYDLGMEYVGYVEPDGYDRVVFRGDVAGREFIAFWTADGRVLAGMNVNVWDVVDPIKALITSRRAIDPERLADPDVALTDLV